MRAEPPPGADPPGTMVDEAQGSSAGALLKPDRMEHIVPGWSSPPPSPIGCSGSGSFLKAHFGEWPRWAEGGTPLGLYNAGTLPSQLLVGFLVRELVEEAQVR